jgi:hypothetical protein
MSAPHRARVIEIAGDYGSTSSNRRRENLARASPKSIWGQIQQARAKAFRPIAIELGWLVFEWNRLHEALAALFGDVVSPTKNKSIPYAIWHSTSNDRTQREMLRAAAAAATTANPQAKSDIAWLLSELNKLAGRRNVAVHSPLIFANEMTETEIIPWWFFGNPRAAELRDKPLLDEFKWYRDHLARLAYFAEGLDLALSVGRPWPERPQLPSRDDFRNLGAKRRKSRARRRG